MVFPWAGPWGSPPSGGPSGWSATCSRIEPDGVAVTRVKAARISKKGRQPMNFGVLLAFRNPPQWRRSFVDIYREHLDQAVAAEDLGYDTVWLTEHHFWEDGWAPSLLPIAAAIATRTGRIRIGTFVVLLPLGKHAVQVAEDAAP